MAQGLVEVKHGLGVFVTQPENEAFGEALLLALRRGGATVWDVEQFDQTIFPEVVALAAITATDEEIAETQRLVDEYLEIVADYHAKWGHEENVPVAELERLRAGFRPVRQAIFAATHNQVFRQLARPLLDLRNLRTWRDDEEDTPETAIKAEADYLHQLLEAITSRDPVQARTIVADLMQLPPEAIKAMRQTPVGEIPVIPISLSRQRK
jgi:DNA-binding FadR family transcriptional regulator